MVASSLLKLWFIYGGSLLGCFFGIGWLGLGLCLSVRFILLCDDNMGENNVVGILNVYI